MMAIFRKRMRYRWGCVGQGRTADGIPGSCRASGICKRHASSGICAHRCEVRNTEVRNTRINTRITYYGIWKYNTLRIANFDRVLLDTF